LPSGEQPQGVYFVSTDETEPTPLPLEPASPFGPLAVLKPRKPDQVMEEFSAPVVTVPGALDGRLRGAAKHGKHRYCTSRSVMVNSAILA
jgi:hypothetical protein